MANGSSVGTAVHWVTLIFLLCRGPRQRPAISKWKWATLCVRQTEPKQEFYLVRKKAVKIKPCGGTINCWSLSHVSRHCPSLLRKVTEPCCFAFSEPLRRGFQIILPHPLPRVRTRWNLRTLFSFGKPFSPCKYALEHKRQHHSGCRSVCLPATVCPPFLQHHIPLSQSRVRAGKLNQLPPTGVSFWKAGWFENACYWWELWKVVKRSSWWQ